MSSVREYSSINAILHLCKATLNDERVKHHTLYENRAYPVFYEEDESGQSLMDKVKKCYEKADNIEAFLDEAYEIIKTNL